MRLSTLTAAVAASISGVAASQLNNHFARAQFAQELKLNARSENVLKRPNNPHRYTNASLTSPFLNSKSEKFVVNGTNIPDVDWDIGESYAGTLSITTNASDPNALYFWFFPSANPAAEDEIVVWLNGGPGCSSMEGLLQENGPFLWQPGTYAPQPNPYSWTNLTNVIWIDQPIGTGFSPSTPDAPLAITNETVVAEQFMGFWKNLVDTFDLNHYKVYLTGESYAGMYVPYIAKYMLETNDTQYFNVKGIQINDPVIGNDFVQSTVPAVGHMLAYNNILGINDSFVQTMIEHADKCGITQWLDDALTFPPKGPQPPVPNAFYPGCVLWDDIVQAATYVNPCFNIYHLTDYCPFLWNVMGTSPAIGPDNYFNRTDVQKAINAPPTDYVICGDPNLNLEGDTSPASSIGAIPIVIERTNNVIIAQGMLDFLLLPNGTLATIQNMTWHGQQGFSKRPSDNFFVPYSSILTATLEESAVQTFPAPAVGLVGGSGFMGTTHTERGLTYVTVNNAGHTIPQYNPGAAYRQLEFLLGRIKSLTQEGDFTTQTGNYTGQGYIT